MAKPIIVADAGLLTKANIDTLAGLGYSYIIGARAKSEKNIIKNEILSLKLNDGETRIIHKMDGNRLIISYSEKKGQKGRTQPETRPVSFRKTSKIWKTYQAEH